MPIGPSRARSILWAPWLLTSAAVLTVLAWPAGVAAQEGAWKDQRRALSDAAQNLLAKGDDASSWQAAQLDVRLSAAEHLFTAKLECMGTNPG